MFILLSSSKITRCTLAGLLLAYINTSLALQIGVVDELAILKSSVVQMIQKPIEAEIAEKEKEIEPLLVRYQKSQMEFNKNQAIMEEKAREQQQQALSTLAKQIQLKMSALDKRRHSGAQKIETVLKSACVEAAKKDKLDIILSNRSGGVLYAAAALDVTQQVVEALPHAVTDSPLS